jgi:ABC-type cobalamin/Fe3+-siderophores transport system ATPase subunit
MQLKSVNVKNRPPIKNFEIDNLSNVVVLAGPNGIGKTRLIQQIINLLQNPNPDPTLSICVEATSPEEIKSWGRESLNTLNPNDSMTLRQHIQRNRRRGKFVSSIINFDSSRTFEQVQPFAWNWNFQDPLAEEIGWNLLSNPFKNRYQDTIHALYKKIGYYRTEISHRYEKLRIEGKTEMPIEQVDPLEKYKNVFSLLLSPKKLEDIPLSNPMIQYSDNGQILPIESLSSGEREVFTVVFDLLLHEPSDCIIFFDEPEVHLHPELNFRLLRALETVGERNQFVFCTHSPDIITQSLNHTVVFIKPRYEDENQAVSVTIQEEKATALSLLGQNLGVIALGKKIILIEGSEASLDKQTYGEIIGSLFPQYVLVPCGGKQTIYSFSKIIENVLSKTLWGIDFFMISDHDSSLPEDAMNGLVEKSANRLAFLPRYHLENYFLDEKIISKMFANMEPQDSWLRDESRIRERLKQLAKDSIPYTIQLELDSFIRSKVGEICLNVKGTDGLDLNTYLNSLNDAFLQEQVRINSAFSFDPIKEHIEKEWMSLTSDIEKDNEEWKKKIPGRVVVNKLSNLTRIGPGRFKSLYIHQAEKDNFTTFDEIINIFNKFDRAQTV